MAQPPKVPSAFSRHDCTPAATIPTMGSVQMAPGPYFTTGDSLRPHDLRGDAANSAYPELGQPTTDDMYALADDALQQANQQERSQFAALIEASTVAAARSEDNATQELDNNGVLRRGLRRESRKIPGRINADLGTVLENSQTNGSATETKKRKRDGEDVGSIQTPNASSALFRQPSSTGKKHTRPPMQKLFNSLELAPENFLQLQAAAKAYMLDDEHPERRDTVGQRGKSDLDMVKLRLFNCVKDFLETERIGEQFFGAQVLGDDGKERTMIWPKDKNRIIAVVTPILRRVITNERQRQYAVETRKGGSEASAKKRKLNNEGESDLDLMQNHVYSGSPLLFQELTGAQLEEYDAWQSYDIEPLITKLNFNGTGGLTRTQLHNIIASLDYHIRVHHNNPQNALECSVECGNSYVERILESGIFDGLNWLYGIARGEVPEPREIARPAVHEVFQTIKNFVTLPPNIEQTGKSPTQGSDRTPSISAEPVSGSVHHSFSCELTFHISLLKNSKLLGPPEDVRREACPFLHSVVQKALTEHGPDDTANSKVRVLLPSGLKLIESDAMWTEAVNEAARLGWMNSLNVLVEL